MSLFDDLSRRMYYETHRQQTDNYIRSRSIQVPEVEDIQEENEDISTTVNAGDDSLTFEYDDYDCEEFEYFTQQRFEDILNERCGIKEKTHFERAVMKTDKIRLTLCLFVLFDMITSLLFNLFLTKTNSTKRYSLTKRIFISESTLVNSLTLGLLGTGINIGILIGIRLKLHRHQFSNLTRRTPTFVGLSICFMFVLHELLFFLSDELNWPLWKASLVFLKSILFGLGLINIINIIFDFKTGSVTQLWARRSIRLFIVTITLAMSTSLLFYQSVLKNRDPIWIDSISGDFLLSRLIISFNIFILFYLLWNGMNQLPKETPILDENVAEFLQEFDQNNSSKNINLQNIIALCLNKRRRRRSESVNHDTVSILTVKGGSFVIIEVVGIALFALSFTSELSHILLTSQNSHHIYPGKHQFWAQFVLFLTIVLFRLLLVFQPVTKTGSVVHRDLLRHYSWHRNCHKYAVVFVANIVGNLLLIFASVLPVICLYLANILIGFSLSLMLEKILSFISSYITITATFFKFAFPVSLMFSSVIIVFLEHFSIKNPQFFRLIFYINLTTSLLSLFQILIISYGSCLHQDDSFDLIPMQPFVDGSPVDNDKGVNSLSKEEKLLNGHIPESTNIEAGPSTSSEAFQSNSNSHLYWYEVAVKDGRRKSSMAVIATRIKYRLESIASILK